MSELLRSYQWDFMMKDLDVCTNTAPPRDLSSSRHTVLVMDDDEMVRAMLAIILKRLGYQVKTCVNGEEAIEEYRSAKEAGTPYLTVIVDLVIPGGMGGKEAAKYILRIDPGAKLIVSSGRLADPAMTDYKNHGFHASLPKPYTASDLAKILTALQPI